MRNYANNVPATTLNGAVNDTTTSWTVANGSGYPAVPFTAKCESEIVLVTVKSGTNDVNWTVTRAYDGSTAASHATSTAVTDAVVAADLTQLWKVPAHVTALGYRASAHTDDDEFDDDSITGWTAVNPAGTATWAEGNGLLSCLFEDQAANDISCQLKAMTPSSSPVTIETATRLFIPGTGVANPMTGLVFTNGTTTTSNAVAIMWFQYSNGFMGLHAYSGTITAMTTQFKNYTNSSSFTSGSRLYLRLIWAGTNSWKVQWSPNGVQWTDYNQGAQSATLAPTYYGVFASSWAYATESIADFEYFRVTESDLYV